MAQGWNRTLFRVHGWLGLTLGLLLFIVCLSGTVATVSSEIDWLLNPAMRAEGELPDEPSWELWYRSVREAHPESHVLTLRAPPEQGWAASATVAYGREDYRNVFVHPKTGQVQGTFSQFNVARFFRSFHKQLYIYPGELPHGIFVVGPLAIVLLVSIVTGILFYKIRWKDLLMRRREWSLRSFLSVSHRASGVWMFGFSLLFAITGFWYLFEKAAPAVGIPLPGAEAVVTRPPTVESHGAARLHLDELASSARRAFPELEVQALYFPVREGSPTLAYGEATAWLVRPSANTVLLDPYTGEALAIQDAADLAPVARLVETMDPLHFGYFGGLPTKLLWLFAGLAISASVLGGPFLWFVRMQQSGGAQEVVSPNSRRIALAVTLAVLSLATYGSFVNIGDSIAHGGEQGLAPLYVWVVVGLFVAVTVVVSIAWLSVLANPPAMGRMVRFRERPPSRRAAPRALDQQTG